jgi:MFS family permease
MNGSRLSPVQRGVVLFAAFSGLIGSGMQLGLMPLAALSVARNMMGESFTAAAGGTWFAWYTAAIMAGAAVGGVLLGNLGDRIGRSKAMSVSILVYATFGILGYFVSSQEQLLLLRFLAGIGVGGMWPNGAALVSECWSGLSRPVAAGVIGMGINIGILCLSQFGKQYAVSPDSWRWLMLVAASPGLLGLIYFALLPESPNWLATRASAADATQTVSVRTLVGASLRHRTIIGIVLATIPLLGAWAASKWLIPWADQVGGDEHPGYKALTQGYWATGATIGSFMGAQVASWLGRRMSYFLISLSSVVVTCGIFLFSQPLSSEFLPLVLLQGFVTTLFFGWLPLYLPELFPTRVRATGTGIAFNLGRVITAAGVFGTGALIAAFDGDYPRVGFLTGMIYAAGMIAIWWAPDTTAESMDG